MSDTLLIAMAEKAPIKPTEVEGRAFHEGFISKLNDEAAVRGWEGSTFHVYVRIPVDDTSYISMTIAPAGRFATLDDLRAFREAQRTQREHEEQQPEQGRLC